MTTNISIATSATARMEKWYHCSLIDYEEKFLYLYIAFNIWYRERTDTTNDREALIAISKDTEVQVMFHKGSVGVLYKSVMEKLIDATVHYPLGVTEYWNGRVNYLHDWPGLIEYWYQVRCRIVHGEYINGLHAQLAYESLRILVDSIRVTQNNNAIIPLDI